MFVPLFSLRIQNTKGETFELTNNTVNYVVTDVSGLLRPASDIRTSSGAGDGEMFNSARIQKRNIVITLRLMGDIEANRQQLYRMFPAKTVCTVFYKNRNRNVRIEGYVEVMDGSIFTEQEEIQISIICPKPYFESLDVLREELSKSTKLFEFPFSIEVNNPIPFSEIGSLSLCMLVNSGDVPCGCIITVEISAEVQNLNIYNTSTQQFFGLDYTFQADDVITLNTKQGEKSISLFRNGETINLLDYMKNGSSWIQLALGANEFTFTASDTGGVKILFSATELYGGV
ncbi:MAG: phage tail family protein [Oscillospiraceae bacterium]|nr:phage tail family protein [Oscillospiraceae bacterium]